MELLKKKKIIYTACNDLVRNDGISVDEAIRTHAVSRKTAEKLSHYIYTTKLTFGNNNRLTKVQGYSDGELDDRDLSLVDSDILYKEYPQHDVRFFKRNINGVHKIGGRVPEEFKVIDSHVNSSFQFIASISKKDPVFSWLPMDELCIAYPLYVGLEKIYFDYTNPGSPVVIDIGERVEYHYNFVDAQTVIEFEVLQLSIVSWEKFNSEQLEMLTVGLDFQELYGHTGIPTWVQYSTVPRCPLSNKLMSFVCQFPTSNKIKLSNKILPSGVIPNHPVTEYLDFYGYGTFYVFIEPSTKIVCCLIQNT